MDMRTHPPPGLFKSSCLQTPTAANYPLCCVYSFSIINRGGDMSPAQSDPPPSQLDSDFKRFMIETGHDALMAVEGVRTMFRQHRDICSVRSCFGPSLPLQST